ncbi:MAG: DoxX family protein [Bacteroidaceae bacterium]|nr:DoxX family protein [Bacteroidaceae bacterium]
MSKSSNFLHSTLPSILVNVVRLVLGLTFLFSGTVKLIDPRGTQYKIEDYGAAFGLSGSMPESLPLVLACVLAIVEFLMGVYLLFGIRRRLTLSTAICFLLIMTPLTFYLALNNPISDCGCFGDAVKLSNWQTFWKNVLLLVLSVFALYRFRLMPHFVGKKYEWIVALLALVFAVLFCSYNLWRLPIIDFRPYHIGADIRQAWLDDQQNFGEYQTTFILEKDGVRKEFSLEEYPDSTWTFIDTKTVQTEATERSGVGDLFIRDLETGEDITPQILENEGYTLLLVAPYLEKADDGRMGELLALHDFSKEAGYDFWCLTSSGEKAIENWKEMTGAEYPFGLADAVVLKTMIRSNPGLMLIHDGKVVGKWPSTDLPTPEELKIKN